MKSAVRVALWLVVVATVTVLARLGPVGAHRSIEHDEGISYLAATAHLADWVEATDGGLTGRWVPAATWLELLEPEKAFAFGRIGAEMASYDIHPPLYFWLLHLWLLAEGTSSTAGPGLNVVLAVLTALAIWGFAYHVTSDRVEATAVGLIWALSPAAIASTVVARQYEALALFVVLFVWGLSRVVEKGGVSRWDLAWVGAATAAGLLTHYHFALVVAGGLLWVALRARSSREGRLLWRASLAIGLGALALPLLHSGFLGALERQASQTQSFDFGALSTRVRLVGRALGSFVGSNWLRWFGPTNIARLVPGSAGLWRVLIVFATGVAAAAIVATRAGRAGVAASLRAFKENAVPLVAALWTLAATVGLYLAFVSPGHAMEERYLAASWPFLAFLPVLAARGIPARARGAVIAGFIVVVMVPGAFGAKATSPAADSPFAGATRVVLDNPRRGVAPRFLLEFDEDTLVFLASQTDLLDDPRPWLEPLGPGDVLASQTEYEATAEGRDALFSLVFEAHPSGVETGTSWPNGSFARVTRPERATSASSASSAGSVPSLGRGQPARSGGARNRLLHGYSDIELGVVWNVVEREIPALRAQLEQIASELDKGEQER